jgi:aminoglycoside phosphotransferase family enzyme
MPDINIPEINSDKINTIDIIKAIIKFENKQITPENINKIKVIETHISLIYLTEKFAYKQKKKVNFGFLDYMSLEKRKFYCRKELSLNRRSCAGVYLDTPELRLKNNDNIFIGYKKG